MRRSSVLAVLALAAMTSDAAGDLGVGDSAPAVSAEKLLNTKLKSLDDLKGKLVLFEYFAWW
ncbi:MAG: hypothetical protein HY812_09550 [Planctomycetes bacterium]|nr:hypothetical protein [Planctomycetota bacterium]